MITIKYFKGLPVDYESFLIERYNSFITTCRYIEVYYSTFNIHYMLVYNENQLTDLLIYGIKGTTSTCFNSLADIDQNIMIEFVHNIYENHPFILKINIVASYKEYASKKTILYTKSDDNILKLPATIEDYYSELGYHVRKNIRNRKVRIIRDFTNVRFITKYGVDIEEKIIDKIILLNCNRMKHKGKIPGIDAIYKNNIYKYSRHYGCVNYLEIDGVMVAGCISSIINKRIFLHVIAHDDNYSKYNVGELCVFDLIQTSVEKGMSTLHFLWGETELKKRFLAEPHVLYSYYFYKRFSSDYILENVNVRFSDLWIKIKHSKYCVPIRDGIKYYRIKKLKHNPDKQNKPIVTETA